MSPEMETNRNLRLSIEACSGSETADYYVTENPAEKCYKKLKFDGRRRTRKQPGAAYPVLTPRQRPDRRCNFCLSLCFGSGYTWMLIKVIGGAIGWALDKRARDPVWRPDNELEFKL